MSTQTMTLTEFLLARIAQDEAEAEAETLSSYSATFNDGRVPTRVRCDPRRLLAECEAKRRLIGIHTWHSNVDGVDYREAYGPDHEEALRILAAVYADHPDYRSEWEWRDEWEWCP